jgi:N-acetylglucosamine-6-phosphate deacetylase
MMQTALTNATFFTGSEMISDMALLTSGDRIKGFIEPSSLPADAKTIDCQGLLVAPGHVDLQIAGGGGFLFSANTSPEALEAITAAILSSGTTGFLLALPTNTHEVISSAFKTVRENPHPAILGLHLEGPYISIAKRGAHVKELIRRPSVSEVTALLKEADGVIKMMTVAPEVCTPEIISILRDNGVTIAAGHSNATFREATDGFSRGIETTTHLFNAMSPLHHRDPGLPGAVFNSDKACASIIADGIHVDFTILTMAKKIMKERLFLISDAVEENDHGVYQHVRQNDRYTLPDGTLSGSKLTMHAAVKNCINHAGISAEEALRMSSLYPAQLIKATDRGVISPGARADFIVMDKDLQLKGMFYNEKMTIIN